ncbi:MAG: redox-regulated ATPase YchF [Candidatus Saccharimonadales bacterium]
MSTSVSCGIVGLPNVGKSTLFNALTKGSALAANYPFATIEPNVGIVAVPDQRLEVLAKLFKTTKIVPASVRFVDIAGLVAGASKGEGLGNQFLAHIRNVSVIVEVVRAFSDDQVTHVNNSVDANRDIDTIMTELALADLETLNRRITKLEKEVKADSKLKPLADLVSKAVGILNDGSALYQKLSTEEISEVTDLGLLTAKPVIYAFNVSESDLSDKEKQDQLAALISPAPAMFVCAKLEREFTSLEDYDASELRESYGMHESGLEELVDLSFKTLGLQTFLTAGEKEVRAWTIVAGSCAREAAGAIHSDMERGFIAADIVSYSDLISLKSWSAARSAGKVRTEGKDYVMRTDDVVEFKFNV